MTKLKRLSTITEFHRSRQLPPPQHPLISVVDYAEVNMLPEHRDYSWVFDFYFVSLKRNFVAKIKYGQQLYDFDEGVMFFIGPGQVFKVERDPEASEERSGWMLMIHPDFIYNTALATQIKRYDFFGYSTHEALFVSNQEETMMMGIIDNISREYHANLDQFSQNIIISQIETLLNYSERFYNRQFLTRKKANHQVLERMEEILTQYFNGDDLMGKGLPTVGYLGEVLHVSPKYLSSLLRVLTGQTALQHIHDKVIEKAKEQLTTTQLSVGEIAYALGFEHPQSFSKFFKSKTHSSPLEFRRSFERN
ncbi:helix-turn-helix domain-containing protein [Pedobacter duraquae]|uniref:AraC-like DNA-binding protein n=1 Tax=Pedobacter duraquae TaxID=425511 RepID=A0A4R6IHU5_9SPHI|nr:helix-turn-helix domain-containing protein [Pedobacter duraquae]TDO21285.1 AraC-like DNA-binding protein [Pedobacter duraquae]